jgi:hypothetical protein
MKTRLISLLFATSILAASSGGWLSWLWGGRSWADGG